MKEAIKRLRSIGERGMSQSDYREVDDSLALYRQDLDLVLHTPTSDEVCMELSRHYKEQVSYSNERHNHLFYFEKSRLGIVLLRHGNIDFYQSDYHKTNYLPPHLVILIGRFYEGLEVKE